MLYGVQRRVWSAACGKLSHAGAYHNQSLLPAAAAVEREEEVEVECGLSSSPSSRTMLLRSSRSMSAHRRLSPFCACDGPGSDPAGAGNFAGEVVGRYHHPGWVCVGSCTRAVFHDSIL